MEANNRQYNKNMLRFLLLSIMCLVQIMGQAQENRSKQSWTAKQSAQYRHEVVLQLGIGSSIDRGKLYDRFYDRLCGHFEIESDAACFHLGPTATSAQYYYHPLPGLGVGGTEEGRGAFEPDLLERVRELDTRILLLEYGGELYAARNLLNSRFEPYATIVLLCDRESLFRSLDAVQQVGEAELLIDGSLLLADDGTLRTVSAVPEGDGAVSVPTALPENTNSCRAASAMPVCLRPLFFCSFFTRSAVVAV